MTTQDRSKYWDSAYYKHFIGKISLTMAFSCKDPIGWDLILLIKVNQ